MPKMARVVRKIFARIFVLENFLQYVFLYDIYNQYIENIFGELRVIYNQRRCATTTIER